MRIEMDGGDRPPDEAEWSLPRRVGSAILTAAMLWAGLWMVIWFGRAFADPTALVNVVFAGAVGAGCRHLRRRVRPSPTEE